MGGASPGHDSGRFRIPQDAGRVTAPFLGGALGEAFPERHSVIAVTQQRPATLLTCSLGCGGSGAGACGLAAAAGAAGLMAVLMRRWAPPSTLLLALLELLALLGVGATVLGAAVLAGVLMLAGLLAAGAASGAGL